MSAMPEISFNRPNLSEEHCKRRFWFAKIFVDRSVNF